MERCPGLPFLPDFKLWKSKIFQKKKHQTADCIPQQSWILEGCTDQSLWGIEKAAGVQTCGNCILREVQRGMQYC